MWLNKLTESLDFSEAWERFSLSIVAAIAIAILFILKTEDLIPSEPITDSVAVRLFYSFSLLYVLGAFFSFNKIKASWPSYQGPVVALVLSLLYFFVLPSYPSEYTFARHLVLLGIVTLAVPLTKFWEKEEESVFWAQVVHSIFLFVETTFFSLFLYATLSLALVAIEKLFNIDFSNIEIYADLFIVIAVIFHPVYFLSKYNKREELRYNFQPNSFIKTFSSKILLGTVLLYAAILFIYFLKIIVTREWPNGWVSNLILSFSIMGILCYGINKYLFGSPATGVLKLFKKWFFPFLFISCIFLSIAIYIRVSEYGITEPRYLVISSAVWLFFVSIYFLLNKRKDLRFIFVSLIAFLFVMFYSPINLFEQSAKSQGSRLSKLIESLGTETTKELSEEGRYEVTQLLQYFDERNRIHDVLKLSPLFSELSFDEYTRAEKPEFLFFFRIQDRFQKGEPIESLCDALGIEAKYSLSSKRVGDLHYSFRSTVNDPISIDSFSYLTTLNYPINGGTIDPLISISPDGKYFVAGLDSLLVAEVLPENYQKLSISDPPIIYNYSTSSGDYRLIIRECNWFEQNEEIRLSFLRGNSLVRIKE